MQIPKDTLQSLIELSGFDETEKFRSCPDYLKKLSYFPQDATSIVPILQVLLNHPNEETHWFAALHLHRYNPETEELATVLADDTSQDATLLNSFLCIEREKGTHFAITSLFDLELRDPLKAALAKTPKDHQYLVLLTVLQMLQQPAHEHRDSSLKQCTEFLDRVCNTGLGHHVLAVMNASLDADYSKARKNHRAHHDVCLALLATERVHLLLIDIISRNYEELVQNPARSSYWTAEKLRREALKFLPQSTIYAGQIIPVLRKLLADNDAVMRWWAAWHLSRLAPTISGLHHELLEAAQSDWRSYVSLHYDNGSSGDLTACLGLLNLGSTAGSTDEGREILDRAQSRWLKSARNSSTCDQNGVIEAINQLYSENSAKRPQRIVWAESPTHAIYIALEEYAREVTEHMAAGKPHNPAKVLKIIREHHASVHRPLETYRNLRKPMFWTLRLRALHHGPYPPGTLNCDWATDLFAEWDRLILPAAEAFSTTARSTLTSFLNTVQPALPGGNTQHDGMETSPRQAAAKSLGQLKICLDALLFDVSQDLVDACFREILRTIPNLFFPMHRPNVHEYGDVEAPDIVYSGRPGQFDGGWLAIFDIIGSFSGRPQIFEGHRKVALSCSGIIPLQNCCIAIRRPVAVKVDLEGRFHASDGKAIEYNDGYGIYAWHGTIVPAHIIESTVTVESIESEANMELRRVLMARFGLSDYLLASGAREIASDNYGILYRKELPGDEPLVMVQVTNSTPEADGSFRQYFVRVPPNVSTAKDAVAWTFDLTSEEYDLSAET